MTTTEPTAQLTEVYEVHVWWHPGNSALRGASSTVLDGGDTYETALAAGQSELERVKVSSPSAMFRIEKSYRLAPS